MVIWAWMQPADRVWKVVSDSEKGTILVYNEKSDLILEKKGLSKEAVSLIEKHFLEVVATRLTGNRPVSSDVVCVKKPSSEYDYMYA